jgi:hypothetical protein
MPKLTGFAPVPIPGPRPLPLFGTPQRLIGFLNDPIGVVWSLRARGDVVAVVDQNPAIVCVFGADRIRDVLANPALFHNPEDFFSGPPGSAREKMRAMVVTTRIALKAIREVVSDDEVAQLAAMNTQSGSARAFARTNLVAVPAAAYGFGHE